MHDAHIRFGLRISADVICEKPVVLNPWNIDALEEIETETGHHVFTILQLRLHPAIIALKEKIDAAPSGKKHIVIYSTSRPADIGTTQAGREKFLKAVVLLPI